MSLLSLDSEDSSSLLELAANNDVEAFKLCIERSSSSSSVDEIGLWYGRKKGSNQMVLDYRTPLMVAATYGSVEILELILSLVNDVDINRCCGSDKTTALHCAASGGSVNAVDAVKVLLLAGADPESVDAAGRRPSDVIVVPPRVPHLRASLEVLLGPSSSTAAVHSAGSGDDFSHLPSSPDDSDSVSSPTAEKSHEIPPAAAAAAAATEKEKREYPVDPSLPDIKNSIYATDEFRMFSFKVRPCSRAYSHDWTECPFVHPGENARRRDPRKYHYSCVPCPDFRKGACRRGDLCEYAHGVFECWLHPAQYRTRLCKDGTGCTRRVCFFAHTADELRPLYVSTGSAVPSPRSSSSAAAAAMDMAAAMSLLPGSPSSVSVMSPSPFTPPMSPSTGNGGIHSTMAWPQPSVPTLHLPGSNLQSSRLRSSLSARDIQVDEFSVLPDFDAQQLLNEFPSFSSAQQSRLGSSRAGVGRTKSLAPSNLEDLFSMEMPPSPRYSSDQVPVFSPSHKAAVLNQFQHQQQQQQHQQLQQQQQQHQQLQQQTLLSPINTSSVFSPKTAEPGHNSFLQASFGMMSPGRMSPRGVEPMSPINSRLVSFTHREQQQQQQHLRSLSSRELGSPANSAGELWSRWGSPGGKVDWGPNGDGLAAAGGGGGGGGRFKRSSSFETLCCSGGEEPDVSWVQSLVKEPSPEMKSKMIASSSLEANSAGNGESQMDAMDHAVLGAWMEQLQLD
ncbi:unnamed protein product [Spirodela intermedia]|uniref:C3H1-type domain-containing protein n=1 Tax=Spirodela intermedia TaxID=51605 RepID=A0A7I8KQD0_SPIIN|nr:unnamed protein product [Spirodela intermedia]